MIIFEIRDGTVREESSMVRGRQVTFRRQEAWVQLNGETRKVRLSLGREQSAYPAGKYQLDDTSFGVNQWGDFTVMRCVLRSIAVAAKSA